MDLTPTQMVRLAVIALVAAGLWLGVPRLYATTWLFLACEVKQTKLKIEEARSEVAEVLRIVSQREGVPIETLRAILREMGEIATSTDSGEVTRLLAAKAGEFKVLPSGSATSPMQTLR